MSALRGIPMLVGRSLRQHALSTIVTVASAALACGLVMAVFNVSKQAEDAFAGDVGFDGVLGARGSKLQLVLNSVFHLETSPGNLPWTVYQEVANDRRVELAVPFAVGDNYLGFRVVGTTPDLFERFEGRGGSKLSVPPGHRWFDADRSEAVVGSLVSRETGLGLGDRFQPSHGLTYAPNMEHDKSYVVTGVLEPTNSPMDRVVWIPIEGVFRMDGHTLRGTGENYEAEPGVAIPDEAKEVSAVMLKFTSPRAGSLLEIEINRQGDAATLAFPVASVMGEIFDKLGWMNRVLRVVAYMVVLVAAGGLLAALYNTMNERRRDFAILRAIGARRTTIWSAIVVEAATIAALGCLFGYFVYALIVFLAAGIVRSTTGVVLDPFAPHPVLVYAPLGMIVLGAFAGLLPAARAYSTDVAEGLSPTS